MTRERFIEIYEVELRQACDDLGDDFDLCREDIDFTDNRAIRDDGIASQRHARATRGLGAG